VTNNIVLGARSDAEDLKAMRAIGVTYVLNISDKVPNHFPDVLVYHRINIPGKQHVPGDEYGLHESIPFIYV
jgi:hypothetical protein